MKVLAVLCFRTEDTTFGKRCDSAPRTSRDARTGRPIPIVSNPPFAW